MNERAWPNGKDRWTVEIRGRLEPVGPTLVVDDGDCGTRAMNDMDDQDSHRTPAEPEVDPVPVLGGQHGDNTAPPPARLVLDDDVFGHRGARVAPRLWESHYGINGGKLGSPRAPQCSACGTKR